MMHTPFYIFLFTEVEALKIQASPEEPHQHEYEELIIGMEGTLEHFIDFGTSEWPSPFVSFVSKGKIHRVKPILKDGKCQMWVIRFKSEFIPETIFQLYAHFHDHANLKFREKHCFDRLVKLAEMMAEEMQQTEPDLAVVRHLLSAVFVMLESELKKQENSSLPANGHSTTFKNFLRILEDNFRRPLGADFYAEKLFMSARNLNIICQNILHQTVTEIIETRKLIEAKNLLTYSEKTVAEIGFELGYQEKSYFTNVFKKRTGQTPTEFREEMRKLLS